MKSLLKLLCGVMLTITLGSTAAAQFGSDNPPHFDDGALVMFEGDILLIVPAAGDRLIAYSNTKDEWAEIGVPKQQVKNMRLTASNQLAACRIEDRVYAYSATSGKWGMLQLSKESTADFRLGEANISVREPGRFYIFGKNSVRWSGRNLETGEAILLDK